MKPRQSVGYLVLSRRCENDIRQTHPEFRKQRIHVMKLARDYDMRLRGIRSDWLPPVENGMTNRMKLAEALGWARHENDTALIIYSLDALRLSELEVASLMLAVRQWSVQVLEAVSGSELTGQVERWEDIVASHDADSRAEAARAMREFKKLATRLGNGARLGRKPYGANEGEQEIVQRILKLRRAKRDGTGRRSYDEIAMILNGEKRDPYQKDEDGPLVKTKPRKGKKWYAKTIQGIVQRARPDWDGDGNLKVGSRQENPATN